ncbi:COX15/CtaA family protein [Terriglobus roseus]|uniref:Cytochrome c oxidase assembly protein subunit 15 n=1 Tax=Terriglobus roseus TaxID=392734 RepID=A0A1H4SZN2_9BACT|nr:COX15/CtaA family protein [Terriglobus roseus]SEC49394.1 cytochrome c oxidase assembly protein subunit 15 [Terriglobus roseus]
MATQITTPAVHEQRSRRGARAWAWATLAFFVIVVLEGAVVRATSSGAGCGDHWPLCNGEVLPHFQRVATVIEFLHRSLTGICTAMFVGLIVWTFYATPKRHPARTASIVAGILLLIEGALGAVLVLGHYVEKNTSDARVLVQSIHFTNTMLLLAAATVVAVLLGRGMRVANAASFRIPMVLTLLASIVTGATGSVAALADTLFPSASLRAAIAADFAANSPLLVRMRWMHPAASLLVVAGSIWLAVLMRRGGASKGANLLMLNLWMQAAIGIADVLTLAPTWIQVLHLLGADLFWITLSALAVPVLFPRATQRIAEI